MQRRTPLEKGKLPHISLLCTRMRSSTASGCTKALTEMTSFFFYLAVATWVWRETEYLMGSTSRWNISVGR
jgi:hypothetical protein